MDLVVARSEGLYSPQADLYIDPLRPVSRAVVTHPGAALRAQGSAELFALKGLSELVPAQATFLEPHQPVQVGGLYVSLAPAGLGPGSSAIRLAMGQEITWVVGAHRELPPPELTETTVVIDTSYGLPIYRWPSAEEVGSELSTWLGQNAASGRIPVIATSPWHLSLLLPLLPREQRCFASESVFSLAQAYAGMGLISLEVAPLPGSRKAMIGSVLLCSRAEIPSRLGSHSIGVTSGRMRIRGIRKRLAVDQGFVLSARPDHRMILAAVRHFRAKRVLSFGVHADPLARQLRERGLDSSALGRQPP